MDIDIWTVLGDHFGDLEDYEIVNTSFVKRNVMKLALLRHVPKKTPFVFAVSTKLYLCIKYSL